MRQRDGGFDAGYILWAYAVVAWVSGFAVMAWGPVWWGSTLCGNPFDKAALVRVFGSIMMAAGCMAAIPARSNDPLTRNHALLWLTGAHSVVGLMLTLQASSIWGNGLGMHAANANFVVVLVLLNMRNFIKGEHKVELLGLFKQRQDGTDKLRSQYEEQIRQAAFQEERHRMARDLHDSIKQQIFAVQTSAATAQTRFDSDATGAKQAIEQVRSAARDAMSEMEAMLDQLNAAPLEMAGLMEALKKQAEALHLRSGIKVQMIAGELPGTPELAPGAPQTLFRVAQEVLSNAARHSRARSVSVTLDSDSKRLWLIVADDGVGFDPNQISTGMGFRNIRERAAEFGGSFEIESHPKVGTRITFELPCQTSTADAAKAKREFGFWSALFVVTMVLMIRGESIGFAVAMSVAFAAMVRALDQWRRAR